MRHKQLGQTNYAAIYLTSFLLVALLGFVTHRDSCANPSYARYMGPETCPTANK